MKRFRVLTLMHETCVPPDDLDGLSDREIAQFKTEYDVLVGLEHLGHVPRALGVATDLNVIRDEITDWKPHVVFNLLEEFHGLEAYVPHVLAYLELIRQPYTGCNPRGLVLTHNKSLTKKILRYHRIPVPEFVVFPRKKIVRRPRRLEFPLIVKSTTVHGSVGIAQASIVGDDRKLSDRVAFVHEQLNTDAIAEQFIPGRELYVGVIGNQRLQVLPVWEMLFHKLSDGAPRIATERVKQDAEYRERTGITTRAAAHLPEGAQERIFRICKRVYRILGQSGYARMDLRLTPDGRVYVLEPNPNPDLAHDEDFALSANAVGMSYEQLIHRIIGLGGDTGRNDVTVRHARSAPQSAHPCR